MIDSQPKSRTQQMAEIVEKLRESADIIEQLAKNPAMLNNPMASEALDALQRQVTMNFFALKIVEASTRK